MRRLNLTLAGGGGGGGGRSNLLNTAIGVGTAITPQGPRTPPPPAAPTPPTPTPTPRAGTQRTGAENIRNQGGGRGMSTASLSRALKQLTGQ